MYQILIFLFIAAAVHQTGITPMDLASPDTCLDKIEHATRTLTRIPWKPISVFPEASLESLAARHANEGASK